MNRQAEMLAKGAELAKQIWDGVTKGFTEFIEDPIGWGKKVVENLKRGISEAWDSFLDWLENLGSTAETNIYVDDNISTGGQKEIAGDWVGDHIGIKGVGDLTPAEQRQYKNRFDELVKTLTGDALKDAILALNEEFGIGQPLPGRSSGFRYVPYNDYITRLHEGEMVSPKREAAQYRDGNGAFGSTSINITINGAQYNSEESLAEAVAYKLQQIINGKGAAYA